MTEEESWGMREVNEIIRIPSGIGLALNDGELIHLCHSDEIGHILNNLLQLEPALVEQWAFHEQGWF